MSANSLHTLTDHPAHNRPPPVLRMPPLRPVGAAAVADAEPIRVSGPPAACIVEIERASAALLRAQPDLEAWRNEAIDLVPVRKPGSVWLVVGVLWLSTVLFLSLATVAIAALLR